MPKVARQRGTGGSGGAKRQGEPYALDKQIEQDASLKPMRHKIRPNRQGGSSVSTDAAGAGDEAAGLTAGMRKKLVRVAKEQREQEAVEEDDDAGFALDDEDEEMEQGEDDRMAEDQEELVDEQEYERDQENMQVTEEDEAALALFGGVAAGTGEGSQRKRTLGDIIAEKLREQEEMMAAAAEGTGRKAKREKIDPRVAELYKAIGKDLASYTHGKLPKAFKVLPSLTNWEDLLFITRPDEWSVHAMAAAVKLFASGLNTKAAQRFYNIVVLPFVRDHIQSTKKLHFALFQALRKALYKPIAFYKGFVLPLCECGDCTLREATIISSVLARTSIPVLHSAACLIRLSKMPYTGATSVFMKTLLDKKYSLPYRVVDAICDHFVEFSADSRKMVVLWHQALLVFVQRYKEDLTSEQKTCLRSLIKTHFHPQITPDIKYELDNSSCRNPQH